MTSRRIWLLLLALVSFVLAGATVTPAAQAVAYPGGKRIYAVTIGGLPGDGATTYPVVPFTRLAMYYFNGDGTVTEAFWAWNWSGAYPDAQTGLTSNGAGCDGCAVRTSALFKTGNATYPKELRGTYTNDGTNVTITWSGGSQETWRVSAPATGLGAMTLTGSNYHANVGQAYGSNVSSSTSVPIASAPLHRYAGRARMVARTNDGAGYVGVDVASGFDLTGWTRCNANCLSTALPASDQACTACKPGEERVIRYYLASEGGRKNYIEHFCTCLLQGGDNPCYAGGSHLKPQLQVIDDAGVLRGWVGVEASNRTLHGGTMGVHWHTDV
jgi:hypothetical protein